MSVCVWQYLVRDKDLLASLRRPVGEREKLVEELKQALQDESRAPEDGWAASLPPYAWREACWTD